MAMMSKSAPVRRLWKAKSERWHRRNCCILQASTTECGDEPEGTRGRASGTCAGVRRDKHELQQSAVHLVSMMTHAPSARIPPWMRRECAVPVVASWLASSVAVMSPMPSTATTTKPTSIAANARVHVGCIWCNFMSLRHVQDADGITQGAKFPPVTKPAVHLYSHCNWLKSTGSTA